MFGLVLLLDGGDKLDTLTASAFLGSIVVDVDGSERSAVVRETGVWVVVDVTETLLKGVPYCLGGVGVVVGHGGCKEKNTRDSHVPVLLVM